MKKHSVPPIAIQYIRSVLHDMGINHIVGNNGSLSFVKFSHPTSGEVTTVHFEDGVPSAEKGSSEGPHFVVQEKTLNADEIKTTRFTAILPLLQHLDVDPELIKSLRDKFEASKARRAAESQEPASPRMGM